MTEPTSDPTLERLLGESAWAWKLARSLARDSAIADDALQDVWLRALIRLPRLGDAPHAARPWLSKVLRNALISRDRGERRRERRERDVARLEESPAVDRVLAREETRRNLVAAVVALPEHYREVILLHFFDGLSPRAIAERLGLPGSTVRTRLQRGLAVLRTQLNEHRDTRGHSALAMLFLEMPRSPSSWIGLTLVKSKLLAIAALCALAWMVWWFAATKTDDPSIAAVIPEESSTGSVSGTEEGPALELPSRSPVAAQIDSSTGASVAVHRLRVVDAETWQPIAGAIVRWADSTELPPTLFPMGDDRDASVIAAGHSTTSDSTGWFEVPESRFPLSLFGEAPGRFGRGHIAGNAEQQQELALTRDGALSVEVVDARGIPQLGVHVFVECADPKLARSVSLRTDARTGFAHFPHAMSDLFGGRPQGAMIVQAQIPHGYAPELVVASEPWPTRPLRLVLPESGSVRVTVKEADGSALRGDALVTLIGSNRSTFPPKLRRMQSNGPVVRFDHVGLDMDLQVMASPTQHVGSWSSPGSRIVGPRQPGEIVDAVYLLGARPAEVVGRAVDANRNPVIRRELLAARREGSSVGFGSKLSRSETDDDGRFVFTLDASRQLEFPDRLCLRTADGEHHAEVVWEPRTSNERRDLGEVLFEPAPLLAAGRVISTDGTPIVGASVTAMWRADDATEVQTLPQLGYWTFEWEPDQLLCVFTDALGHFVMRAKAIQPRGALKVSTTGYSSATDIEFEPGDDDIVIQLEPSVSLQGRVLSSRPEVLARATIEVIGSSPTRLDRLGRFFVRASGSAPANVDVRIDGCAAPVVVMRGIESNDDPRLGGIELDGFVRCIEVSARDHNGDALAKFEVVWTSASDPGTIEHGFAGRAVVVTNAEEISLQVCAPGCDDQRVEGVRENVDVQLAAGPYLVLRVPETTPLPPSGLSLSVVLESNERRRDRREISVPIQDRETRFKLPARGQWTVQWIGGVGPRGKSVGLEVDVIDLTSGEAFGVSVLDLSPAELEKRWATLR